MKLIGYINGVEVSFDFYPPNTWRATIPTDITGRFVLQLKAIDDAGNSTNNIYVYVYIDFQNMIFKVLDKKFGYKNNSKDYCYGIIDNEYETKYIEDEFIYNKLPQKYSYRKLVV